MSRKHTASKLRNNIVDGAGRCRAAAYRQALLESGVMHELAPSGAAIRILDELITAFFTANEGRPRWRGHDEIELIAKLPTSTSRGAIQFWLDEGFIERQKDESGHKKDLIVFKPDVKILRKTARFISEMRALTSGLARAYERNSGIDSTGKRALPDESNGKPCASTLLIDRTRAPARRRGRGVVVIGPVNDSLNTTHRRSAAVMAEVDRKLRAFEFGEKWVNRVKRYATCTPQQIDLAATLATGADNPPGFIEVAIRENYSAGQERAEAKPLSAVDRKRAEIRQFLLASKPAEASA